jgi:hypothetical protein
MSEDLNKNLSYLIERTREYKNNNKVMSDHLFSDWDNLFTSFKRIYEEKLIADNSKFIAGFVSYTRKNKDYIFSPERIEKFEEFVSIYFKNQVENILSNRYDFNNITWSPKFKK